MSRMSKSRLDELRRRFREPDGEWPHPHRAHAAVIRELIAAIDELQSSQPPARWLGWTRFSSWRAAYRLATPMTAHRVRPLGREEE